MRVRRLEEERPAEHDGRALAADLADFAVALRDAAQRWNDAVRELVPVVPGVVSAAERYAHARAAWPAEPPPSYEEIAGVLAAVHDATGGLVAVAGQFDAASRVVGRALRNDGR